ncbi:MAG TPA: Bax inhibitor-1/YccA family protein [Bacteroidales bacterium]|nr:Bax inhibitor-1/YccA family protein [Bacteroidales bacterium]HPS18390.1 Bax inhibitor-1/YccA family protein [Bacteroidales bacterium]
MFNFNQNQNNENTYVNPNTGAIAVPKTFIANVFSWMAIALGITAFFAYTFSKSDAFFNSMFTATGMSPLGWIIMLSPFAIVMAMSFGANKFSAGTLTLLFIAYAFLMGLSLSFIFWAYTAGSIFITFAVTAGTFAVMAFAGYTTKTDLSKMGAILSMALIGIIIAMIVNFFMHSQQLDYIVSILGVLIFTGLTAWDVQKLKRIGAQAYEGSETTRKLVIMGALTLYLDFINLFLFLLRFLGNRK